eukprot:TRINITY_DN6973_c0_g1_i12.p2 TRINITY_DN6973_c0_g1~~TRINITY_DN6973_c0_g1_i12.p2  ORF type:complete len:117 (+),score=1.58 TRINITY_DN6973_c0_g1_i12:509-859(+)
MAMASISLMLFSIFFGILVFMMDHIVHTLDKLVTFNGVASLYPEAYALPNEEIILNCVKECHYGKDNGWIRNHIMDSWDQIWGVSLVGFILGAYTLAGSIYLNNTTPDESRSKAGS